MRHSCRLQGLPPDSPPAMEGNRGETMDRLASVDSHVEDVPITKTREEFSAYDNPLVQLPPTTDSTFHFPMEGRPSSSDWFLTTHQMTL